MKTTLDVNANNNETEMVAEIKWYQLTYVKTFYLINKKAIFLIYNEVTDSTEELTQKNWNKFVNSAQLHDMIYRFIGAMTDCGQESLAYGKMADNLGIEMHTDNLEIFIAMPMIQHDSLKSLGDTKGAILQAATRFFITTLCHMFFKDLYGKPFVILKEHEGWFLLNENYEYVSTK